ncbi:hypothetical protein JTE90_016563 [Oedothorax gibbosus]|uniref:Dicer-2 n=1 Tax=Oedothorax gibbosus TaxID=931172 RepID=A0AAV6UDA0_9ARAC|nr:hypothetical protein JTE90_016563 [Oedothorax gibbosus]
MAESGNNTNSIRNEEEGYSATFKPRDYQLEILEEACKTNTIAFLGTGTGKTFIAAMLIRKVAHEVRKPYLKGGKRVFFLVPTVPLVIQQARTIKDHTDLVVKGFHGDIDVDSSNKQEWEKKFCENEVLVMTGEIFEFLIVHTYIKSSSIQLLIIDECHRAQGNHPYKEALKCFVGKENIPRILGLSATLINGKCKPSELEKKLRDLELSLWSKIFTASDIVDLQRYGTDPREFIAVFGRYKNIDNDLIKETKEKRNEMQLMKDKKNEEPKVNKNKYSHKPRYTDEALFFEKPLKSLASLITIFETLGAWCACKAAKMYADDLQTLLKKSLPTDIRKTFTETYDFLMGFISIYQASNKDSEALCFDKMPSKLQRLLGIFRSAKKYLLLQEKVKQEKCDGIPLCSIIFVEMKITAYVLQEWLSEVKSTIPEFDFLNPEYIIGHGSCDNSKASMTEQLQRKKLKDFRDKKSNVLVATQVLEEGMDIRQCNLVIRFDGPGDFRSYIQSKGRARAQDSLYVMMVEEGEKLTTFIEDLVDFKIIEKELMDKCLGRSKPQEEDIAMHMLDAEIPPYMPKGPDGPRITMNDAIKLINRYCTSLPTDRSFRLIPEAEIIEVDSDCNREQFVCKLKLPKNSSLKQTIIGDVMNNKRCAKKSAALKACIKLHESGELDDYLVPTSFLIDKAIEDESGEIEKEDGDGAKPGTNRRRQVYDKRVPVFLKDAKPQPKTACYVHVLEMKLVTPLPNSLNPRKRPLIDPANTTRKVALLTTKMLPPVNPFKIFTKCGKILVTVKTSRTCISLDEEEIQNIERFHRFIFLDALWLEKDKIFTPNTAPASYYIIPVNQSNGKEYEIDWSFISYTLNHTYNAQKKNSARTADRTEFNEEVFTNAVLIESYKIDAWKKKCPIFHQVVKIQYDLSPNSLFKDLYPDRKLERRDITFKEHLLENCNVMVQNDSQPLVEVINYHSLQMWLPLDTSPEECFDSEGTLSKTKQKHKDFRDFLIPEVCLLHPFNQDFFFQVNCIPTVLWRLNGLLLAEEIRQAVAREAHVGIADLQNDFEWPPFHLETSDRKLTEHLIKIGELQEEESCPLISPKDIKKNSEGIITSFEVKQDLHKCTGPAPSQLLQALTAKSAGDEFNLERLEMIGDSFLKYVMSVKTYIKYTDFHEGWLTKFRSSLIQNLYLYQKATKKNLGQFLTVTGFDSKNNWLPPCYFAEDKIDENILIKKTQNNQQVEKVFENLSNPNPSVYYTKHVISDKCIADSVEALIGLYLLTCGYQGALRFMQWFGLKPLVEHNKDHLEEHFEQWPPTPPNPIPSSIVDEVEDIQERLDTLTNGFDRFEDIINYRFKNKAYLLQAFTHPSFYENDLTDCYQRLEFLGDAVLDYLITRQLYEDPSNHSPGTLTDLRSALVNNVYFASLAVKYEYHKFLDRSPDLFHIVNKFTEALEDIDEFKFFEKNGYYLEEVECFEMEEIVVPKALGDIFESVAGAIYLDSGMSLDKVWEVCFPMIRPAFEHLCKHVPISPVRELYAKVKPLFSEAFTKDDQKTYIEVTLEDNTKVQGVGPNKKIAKKSAAKRALAVLKDKKGMDIST